MTPIARAPSGAASPPAARLAGWRSLLDGCRARAAAADPMAPHGRLVRAAGLVMECVGLRLPVGSVCTVDDAVDAEVVGFDGDRLFLMPTGDVTGIAPGAIVRAAETPVSAPRLGVAPEAAAASASPDPLARATARARRQPIGRGLLGRVVDAQGRPIDHLGPLTEVHARPLVRPPIDAMDREPIRAPLSTGVRAIDALNTVGRGQRIGLFAGSGVGKSVLMGMMARYTSADVTVVGLIGERGREVKEFIEDILGPEGRTRAVVVAAPADAPPLLRLRGALYATAIAEHFRDAGRDVLLLMDSLTRYAQAAREIALAIGEPPATKGYPPSVFARLPALVERAGNAGAGQGSITGFYTVLAEGDDVQDPVADSARAILDGHLVLSRALAEEGHYPAIDIEQSVSRVMHNVVDAGHLAASRRLRAMWSRHRRCRDLLAVGAYVPGQDPETDRAIALQPRIATFLQQDLRSGARFADARQGLDALAAAAVGGRG